MPGVQDINGVSCEEKMISLKCSKVENNPEKKEAVLWIKDNDDNTPQVRKIINSAHFSGRMDLIETSVFDKKNQRQVFEFYECVYIQNLGNFMDKDLLVMKIMISYRSMERK